MKKNILLVLVTFVSSIGIAACTVSAEGAIRNYSECVAAGNKVLRSFPGRCVTKDGKSFVDESAILNQPLIDTSAGSASEGQKVCKDLCGNQSCEAMVCMAVGCPCPETNESCPADCNE